MQVHPVRGFSFMSSIMKYSRCDGRTIVWLAAMACLGGCIPLLSGYELSSREYGLNLCAVYGLLLLGATSNYALGFCSLGMLGLVGYVFVYKYGAPNAGMLVSLADTNRGEVGEFVAGVPGSTLVWFAFLVICWLIYVREGRRLAEANAWQKTTKLLLLLIGINCFAWSVCGRFYGALWTAVSEGGIYLADLSKLPKSDWRVLAGDNTKRYKTYVVVVGESVRKDVLSVYGAKQKTTPFLDKVPGEFYGMYSPSWNTQMSLPRMLALADNKKINYGANAVALAKAGGYKTYWLSNQGRVGVFDTPVSLIAEQADEASFIKRDDYLSQNTDDFLLLDKLAAVLRKEPEQDKVIFLHMMGSHRRACERLFGQKVEYDLGGGRQLDCYYASVNKLDLFLRGVIDNLRRGGGAFSVIYFSDHGQTFDYDNKIRPVDHGGNFKQDYAVPLFVINSDSARHSLSKKVLSGFDFLPFLADRLGVRVELPKLGKFDFHEDDGRDVIFNGSGFSKIKYLGDNPPP